MKLYLQACVYISLLLAIIITLSSCANRLGKEAMRLSFKKPTEAVLKDIDLAMPDIQQRVFMLKTKPHHYEVYSCQDNNAYHYYPFERNLCKKLVINTSLTEGGDSIFVTIYPDPSNWVQKIKSVAGVIYNKYIEKSLKHVYLKEPVKKQNIKLNYLPSDFSSHYIYSLIDDKQEKLTLAKKESGFKSVSFLQRNSLTENQYLFINAVINNVDRVTVAHLSCEYVWQNKVSLKESVKDQCDKSFEEIGKMLSHLMELTPKQLKEAIYRLRLHLYDVY